MMRAILCVILGVVCVAGAGCVNTPYTVQLNPAPNTCQVIYSRGGTPMQTVCWDQDGKMVGMGGGGGGASTVTPVVVPPPVVIHR